MTVLAADAVTRHYPVRGGHVLRAVDGVFERGDPDITIEQVDEAWNEQPDPHNRHAPSLAPNR